MREEKDCWPLKGEPDFTKEPAIGREVGWKYWGKPEYCAVWGKGNVTKRQEREATRRYNDNIGIPRLNRAQITEKGVSPRLAKKPDEGHFPGGGCGSEKL